MTKTTDGPGRVATPATTVRTRAGASSSSSGTAPSSPARAELLLAPALLFIGSC